MGKIEGWSKKGGDSWTNDANPRVSLWIQNYAGLYSIKVREARTDTGGVKHIAAIAHTQNLADARAKAVKFMRMHPTLRAFPKDVPEPKTQQKTVTVTSLSQLKRLAGSQRIDITYHRGALRSHREIRYYPHEKDWSVFHSVSGEEYTLNDEELVKELGGASTIRRGIAVTGDFR